MCRLDKKKKSKHEYLNYSMFKSGEIYARNINLQQKICCVQRVKNCVFVKN